MIAFRLPRVRITSFTPLSTNLRASCNPIGWVECRIEGSLRLHLIVYADSQGGLGLVIPPEPLNRDLPDWIVRHVSMRVRAYVLRRMREGA